METSVFGGAHSLPHESFIDNDSFVTSKLLYETYNDINNSIKFLKAGPREHLFTDPRKAKVCIVTCGGLCPGLNVVIRELVMCLWYNYEVRDIFGIKWGYKGFYTDIDQNWIKLDPQRVKYIHKDGGTMLGSGRGGFEADKMLDSLVSQGITQVYVIGGDGTHRGINALIKRAAERDIVISFAGIPKTIDNDIPLIDHSFGFNTSVEVATRMIQAAYVDAKSQFNGVGVVKLMGRYAGFIAHAASLANNEVDFCIIPELPYELSGPNGLLNAIVKRVKQDGHCVVVVAEGAEEGLINPAERLTKEFKHDAAGNRIYDDILACIEPAIIEFAQNEHKMKVNVSAIDPTYAIRSVQANAGDTLLCSQLA